MRGYFAIALMGKELMKIVLVTLGAVAFLSSGVPGQGQKTGDLVVQIENVDREHPKSKEREKKMLARLEEKLFMEDAPRRILIGAASA